MTEEERSRFISDEEEAEDVEAHKLESKLPADTDEDEEPDVEAHRLASRLENRLES